MSILASTSSVYVERVPNSSTIAFWLAVGEEVRAILCARIEAEARKANRWERRVR
jgi:hypothetical protein